MVSNFSELAAIDWRLNFSNIVPVKWGVEGLGERLIESSVQRDVAGKTVSGLRTRPF